MNRALIKSVLKLTPYELYKGRNPKISHLHVFRCKCFILNNEKDNFGIFDAKTDEGVFLGNLTYIKAFRVFNKTTVAIEESLHVTFDESNPSSIEVDVVDYEGILEKTSIEDDDQEKDQGQGQENDQSLNGETQDEEANL